MVSGRIYEWDERKSAENVRKGRPSFEGVLSFDFSAALIWQDDRADYGEPRMIAIGLVGDRHHVLVYTERPGSTRVISFRKANDREIKRYDRQAQIAD